MVRSVWEEVSSSLLSSSVMATDVKSPIRSAPGPHPVAVGETILFYSLGLRHCC